MKQPLNQESRIEVQQEYSFKKTPRLLAKQSTRSQPKTIFLLIFAVILSPSTGQHLFCLCALKMRFGYLEIFCVFVVAVQLFFGVWRWAWKNFMKQKFCKPVEFKNFGEWARE
jgi:hypothetical protein